MGGLADKLGSVRVEVGIGIGNGKDEDEEDADTAVPTYFWPSPPTIGWLALCRECCSWNASCTLRLCSYLDPVGLCGL
jgi:hypothetical protein